MKIPKTESSQGASPATPSASKPPKDLTNAAMVEYFCKQLEDTMKHLDESVTKEKRRQRADIERR
jgi:hypothetical protein